MSLVVRDWRLLIGVAGIAAAASLRAQPSTNSSTTVRDGFTIASVGDLMGTYAVVHRTCCAAPRPLGSANPVHICCALSASNSIVKVTVTP